MSCDNGDLSSEITQQYTYFAASKGISHVKIIGEARSADNDLVPGQTSNARERALYFRLLQDKTISVKSDIHKHSCKDAGVIAQVKDDEKVI